MGLPLIKQIVSEHMGEISVKSEIGKGTTVTMVFPVRWSGVNQKSDSGIGLIISRPFSRAFRGPRNFASFLRLTGLQPEALRRDFCLLLQNAPFIWKMYSE